MKRRKRWLVGSVIAFAMFTAMLFFAHPWLAITERSGGKVMVVEGWMDDEAIVAAALLFREGGYEHIYTTGTTRPFAYYLVPGARIDLTGLPSSATSMEIGIAGLPNCRVIVIAGTDTLLNVPVSQRIATHGVDRIRPLGDLRIVAEPQYPQPGPPSVFIHSLRIDGTNAHELALGIRYMGPDSAVRSGEPTYAHHCAHVLEGSGIPPGAITPVPAGGDPVSRSWANASTLAFHLGGKNISALDVVTLGVHARRSRALYREALGPNVQVGVISIPDPECGANSWWKSKKGWYTLLKEIAGSQQAHAVEVAR